MLQYEAEHSHQVVNAETLFILEDGNSPPCRI